MPALAATTAFMLCRHVTRSFWPSLAGGYLFGFSSYVLGHELAHLHATSIFLVPLAALFVLRFLEEQIGARGLVVRLGLLLALQLSFGTEVFFTLSLCLAAGLVLGFLVVPAKRRRLGRALLPIAGAYGVCAVIVSPLLYYAATGYQGVITPTTHNPADLVTFGFPTGLTAIGGSLAQHFVPSLPPVSAENGQYLGLPTLAIIVLFAISRLRRPGAGSSCSHCSWRAWRRSAPSYACAITRSPLSPGACASASVLRQRDPGALRPLHLARRVPDRCHLGGLAERLSRPSDPAHRARRRCDRAECLEGDLARAPAAPRLLHRKARPALPAAGRERPGAAAAVPQPGAPLAGRERLPVRARRRRPQRRRATRPHRAAPSCSN